MADSSGGAAAPAPDSSDAAAQAAPAARPVPAQVFQALADQDWQKATELVEANWGFLSAYHLHVVRAVADALPDEFLTASPRWSSVRDYTNHMLLGPRLRPTPYTWHPRRSARQTPIDALAQLTEAAIEARSRGEYEAVAEHVTSALELMARIQGATGEAGGQLLPAMMYQLGLAAEFAAREEDALDAFQKAYAFAAADGDVRTAANASSELAWLHALAGRGRAAGQWIDRRAAIAAGNSDPRMLRSTVHIALAARAHDGLRLAEAAAELAKADDGMFDEHRAVVVAHRAMFDAFSERGDTWETLGRIDAEDAELGPLAHGPGLNRFILDYARAVVLDFGGQPERALATLDAGIAAGGARYLLARRSATHYSRGDFKAAEKDADLVIGTKRIWPRSLTEGLVVKAACAWRRSDRLELIDAFEQAVRVALDNELLVSLAVIPLDDLLAITGIVFPERPPVEVMRVAGHPQLFVPPVIVRDKLTPQEHRVLRELAQGRTLLSAAARLHVTENTVKAHTRAIYRKLGVRSRSDMIAEATRRGLI